MQKKFLSARPVVDGLQEARKHLRARASPALKKLFVKSDEELIEHLVDTRGTLHHHALRSPRAWHPEKPDHYEAEAQALQSIVHEIALKEVISLIYSEARDESFLRSVKEVGAMFEIRSEVFLNVDGRTTRIESFSLRIPGRKVNIAMIDLAHRELRKVLTSRGLFRHLEKYNLLSADGREVYATYKMRSGSTQ